MNGFAYTRGTGVTPQLRTRSAVESYMRAHDHPRAVRARNLSKNLYTPRMDMRAIGSLRGSESYHIVEQLAHSASAECGNSRCATGHAVQEPLHNLPTQVFLVVGQRGTSVARTCTNLGPNSRSKPRALWWSLGDGRFLVNEVTLHPTRHIIRIISACAYSMGGVRT